MAVPKRDPTGEPDPSQPADTELVYANDVRVVADPGGVHLVFTRTRPEAESGTGAASGDHAPHAEVIARLVLPPLAASRLLRLLPGRLDRQRALAEDYARETERESGAEVERDPFLAALAAADEDDEPFTDAQRAAAREGWDEFLQGETIPWEEVRRELLEEDDASPVSAS